MMSSRPHKPKPTLTRRRFLKLAAFGLVTTPVSAALLEPRDLEVTRHDAPLSLLPRDLDGFRIVQLSDLHRCFMTPDSLIRSAVEAANRLSPDVVVVTGDFVTRDADNAGPCAEMLSRLAPRLGVYAVLGNHDHWTNAAVVRGHIGTHGIRLLDNACAAVSPGLELIGIDDVWSGSPDFEAAWRSSDPQAAHVFLSHSPVAVRNAVDKDCLMLAGHTHGGQVNIPFVPMPPPPGMGGWRYVRGWYNVGRVRMYVNRGIGHPVRFRCRPEVTLFMLRSA